MSRRRSTGTAIATAVVVGSVGLAGCGGFQPTVSTCSQEAVPGMAIVVGNRANSPSPVVPAEVSQRLDALIDESYQSARDGQATVGVTIIQLDGDPEISCTVQLHIASNGPAREDAEKTFRANVEKRVSEVRADKEEADVLKALGLAAAAAQPGGTVVLIDSGLSTVAPLDFADPQANMVGAEPAQILEQLLKLDRLPDLTDRTVVLAGIGYTAPPQEPLHEGQHQLLVHLWEELARRAGATEVIIDRTPNTKASAPGLPSVRQVPVPDPGTVMFACNSETILRNDGTVGFVPDTTIFLDEEAARRTLRDLADFLLANTSAQVTLVGNIAHYGTDVSLAARRAEAVRDVLVQFGVPASRITAMGDGWGPYPTKTAPPDPASDQQNRRVVVKVSCG